MPSPGRILRVDDVLVIWRGYGQLLDRRYPDGCEPLGYMKKILVIDDDDQLIELVQLSLTITSNWKVIPAMSGPEAVEILKTERPDAILLDFHMPTMDGLEALALIRQTPQNREIPVLAYTGDTTALDPNNLPEGITGLLIKPFNPEALAGRLEALWR